MASVVRYGCAHVRESVAKGIAIRLAEHTSHRRKGLAYFCQRCAGSITQPRDCQGG
jgi:hypothetical protein